METKTQQAIADAFTGMTQAEQDKTMAVLNSLYRNNEKSDEESDEKYYTNVTKAMQAAGWNPAARAKAGLKAWWNNKAQSGMGSGIHSYTSTKVARFLGLTKTADFIDRWFTGPAKPKKGKKGKKAPAEKTPTQSTATIESTESGSLIGFKNQLDMITSIVQMTAEDVTDIKSLLMPKGVVAKGKGGEEFVQFNPLAPQGEQFNRITESGKLTAQKPSKEAQKSAEKKAALETAKLALAIQEKDRAKVELRKKYAFKEEEEKYKVEDPNAEFREEVMEKVDHIGDAIEELKSDSIFGMLLKAIPFVLPIFKFLAEVGFVGLVTILVTKVADEIMDRIKKWWDDNQVEAKIIEFTQAISDKMRGWLERAGLIKSEAEYKAEEEKNAKAGRTRGGIASAANTKTIAENIVLLEKQRDAEKDSARKTQIQGAIDNLKKSHGLDSRGPKSRGRKPQQTIPAEIMAEGSDTVDTNYADVPVAPVPKSIPKVDSVGSTGTLTTTANSGTLKNELMKAMDESGIEGAHRSQLIAQAHHESAGFTTLYESLNYTPKALKSTFSYYAKNPSHAEQDGRTAGQKANQENIANRAYGKRNGNIAPDDGWKYRGRGIIQLTGKSNYKEMSDLIGLDLVKNPDLAADPTIAAKIAVTFYKNKVIKTGIKADDIKGVTRAINGPKLLGLAERGEMFTQLQQSAPSPVQSSPETRLASNVSPAPTPTLPGAIIDSQSRQKEAATSSAATVAMVAPTTVVNNTNVSQTVGKRPAARADVLSQDKSLVRSLAKDAQHPVYG